LTVKNQRKTENSIGTDNHDGNMLRTAKNLRYFFICGPLTIFLLMKLTLRAAQQFEFDMPALEQQKSTVNPDL
jgi:hypothetical protein